jgi:4a-hydroxytetrahydrobiopterin dehydratase
MIAAMKLAERHCRPLPRGTPPITAADLAAAAAELPGWTVAPEGGRISRTFAFADFRAAMAFVVAMADLANAEDHHPDFTVRWNRVEVTLSTHSVGGLSENDLILAARLDALGLALAAKRG